ncbi:MAG: endo-1,4-beta-xylanase, partial [Clostridium sp.]|nr:endo-1,4-beta-xylanase [Clostridium sp.]
MNKLVSIAVSAVLAMSTALASGVSTSAASVPSNANLLNTYGNVIPKVGTALEAREITNPGILQYAKKEYNS